MEAKSERTIEKLINENEQLKICLDETEARLKWYEEQFRLFQQQRYGVKSEKITSGQLNLFNDAEEVSDEKKEEPTFEEVTYKRRKEKRSKKDLIKELPVETIEYKLDEKNRLCPYGHGLLKVMGKETTKEIAIIPAKTYVIEHVQFKYVCKECEIEGNKNNKTPIMIAPKPKKAIPGSMASSSLIAHIIDQKYTYGMPLYRQEQQFMRNGLDLSRQSLANWVIKAAGLFEHLYNRMHELLLKKDILMADETTVQVLHEVGRAPTTKSYMWLYRTGKFDNPIVLYDYQETRSGDHPKQFLSGYKGYLHCDGYYGYNKLDNIIRIGCLAHVRRGYMDALKALPKNANTSRTLANKGLNFCNALYKIEQKIKDLSIEERQNIRLKMSKPILDDFLSWLKEQSKKVLPKSKLSDAINYTINQWEYVINYLLDGRLEIDNNRSERSIKPFVIGRKGWLFSNTPKGAKSSAILYSIVETAKENKIKLFDYLKYLLDKLPNINVENKEELDKLLPWSALLPKNYKLTK
jgi:transposase